MAGILWNTKTEYLLTSTTMRDFVWVDDLPLLGLLNITTLTIYAYQHGTKAMVQVVSSGSSSLTYTSLIVPTLSLWKLEWCATISHCFPYVLMGHDTFQNYQSEISEVLSLLHSCITLDRTIWSDLVTWAHNVILGAWNMAKLAYGFIKISHNRVSCLIITDQIDTIDGIKYKEPYSTNLHRDL